MQGRSMFCYVMYAFYVMGRKATCYGPEGNMLWAGRQYVMGRKALRYRPEGDMFWDRKVVAWKGVYVVGILGVSH